MAHLCKCAICGVQFDRDTIQAVRHGARRYSHQTCEPNGELVPLPQKKEKPKTETDLILEYCEHIFGKEKTNYAMIKKQIKQFVKEYGYTESGIRKTLIYIYDIKKMPTDKANGAIGIVPYLWSDAYSYYLGLYNAQQVNEGIDVAAAANKEKEIKIKLRKKEKRFKLFNFWSDEEEVNDEEETE